MDSLVLARYSKDFIRIILKDEPHKLDNERHSLSNLIDISDDVCYYFSDKKDEVDRLKTLLKKDLDFFMDYMKKYTYKTFNKDYRYCILMYLICDDLNESNYGYHVHGIRLHNYKEGMFNYYSAIQYHDGNEWVNIGEPNKLRMSLFENFVRTLNKKYLPKLYKKIIKN